MSMWVRAPIFDIVDQLHTLIHDDSWKCAVSYVNPARNRVARFLAKFGMETCRYIYTFDKLVGDVLLDWDRDMGLHHPLFIDIFIPSQALDPLDFNISMSLAEHL